MLKIALVALALNANGDYDMVKVKEFTSDQGCIEAQVDYLNRNETAYCRPMLPDGTVVPPGHYPKQNLNTDNTITWTYSKYPDDLPEAVVIRPHYERQPDIIVEVR